jgi:subtilisin family serine protease
LHGSHCSGIIAAIRGNNLGGDGVADNVLIMPIRAVPNGDERDKDIALGIRYAVDNGAQVINMSFGKKYSPQSEEVIKAIRYAEAKGVLCVHAAGNSGLLTDDQEKNGNFPSPQYPSMSSRFTNWIEVGASTRYGKAQETKMNKKGKVKKQGHNGLAASFSNYGTKTVDVFAPGLEIYSTVPQSEYLSIQGTSMAAPMVAGLAALLKGYYPELTMIQVKEIIFESVKDVSQKITPIPGGDKEVKFGELSTTGGIVNTYNAVKLAEQKTKK